jgi:SAM-dependent methyltransferase
LNPPKDYTAHYPKDYFTFQQKHEGKIKSILNRYRDKAAMGDKSFLGNILYKKFAEPTYISRLKIAGVGIKDSILDVGCGKGILLHKMKESGFYNVIGIDPFIDDTINYKNGLKILKKDFNELKGKFDFIMFNHSFEHMENPLEVMNQSNKHLNKNKFLLLRIPVADSYACKHYRENWCSLDAPRHLFLHTKKSIKILANESGFEIKKINYDSRSWQLWGSEQYSKNISLMDERSYYINPKNSIFTKNQIDDFEKRTIELNKNAEGDQAEFYMQKIN